MRLQFFLTLMIAVLALAAGACDKGSSGGTPGTTDAFVLSPPTFGATSMKQGERKTIKLSFTRKADFKQALTFTATEPSGLKVNVEQKRVAASDPAEVSLTVDAEKTAALGEHVIKVTATPESGSAATVDVKVKVEEGPK